MQKLPSNNSIYIYLKINKLIEFKKFVFITKLRNKNNYP